MKSTAEPETGAVIGFARERRHGCGCSLSALGADATKYEIPLIRAAGTVGAGVFMMCAGWGVSLPRAEGLRGGSGRFGHFTFFSGGWLL